MFNLSFIANSHYWACLAVQHRQWGRERRLS
jgi:hypothetical protein